MASDVPPSRRDLPASRLLGAKLGAIVRRIVGGFDVASGFTALEFPADTGEANSEPADHVEPVQSVAKQYGHDEVLLGQD